MSLRVTAFRVRAALSLSSVSGGSGMLWNADSERCSLGETACHADFSPVHLRNLSGDCEAKTKAIAAAAGICAIEAIKDMRQR